MIIVKPIPFGDARDAEFVRLLGYDADVPEAERMKHPATWPHLVSRAMLADGATTLEAEALAVEATVALRVANLDASKDQEAALAAGAKQLEDEARAMKVSEEKQDADVSDSARTAG